MFAQLFFVASLAIAAIAGGHESHSEGGIKDSCNTQNIQCCNSVQQHTDDSRNFFASFLGAKTGDLSGQFGTTCSPTTIGGVGSGSSCSSQPVCCENNSFNGVVALGCSPINVNA